MARFAAQSPIIALCSAIPEPGRGFGLKVTKGVDASSLSPQRDPPARDPLLHHNPPLTVAYLVSPASLAYPGVVRLVGLTAILCLTLPVRGQQPENLAPSGMVELTPASSSQTIELDIQQPAPLNTER